MKTLWSGVVNSMGAAFRRCFGFESSFNPLGRHQHLIVKMARSTRIDPPGESHTIKEALQDEIEVIPSRVFDDGVQNDPEKQGEIVCCPAMCTNCSPRRVRVNIAILVLLLLFSVGASIGAFTRPNSSSSAYSQNQDAYSQNQDESFASDDESIDDESPGGDGPDLIFSVESPYLVGVYYYPWHGSNFHNGGGYLRQDLIPPQAPALGEYDDSKPDTIAQHLKWSRQANIGLWVTSWWGPNLLEDSNTKNVIMEHEDLGEMKIALHYETDGRINNGDTSNVVSDIAYICQTYFSHPNYYRINERPVLVVYITRVLESQGILDDVLQLMRSTASSYGHDIYVIGDHVFGDAPDLADTFDSFSLLDAVTNYDVYGSMGRPIKYAGTGPIDDYYTEQMQWRTKAIMNGCRFIPAASPGYNDRSVRFESNHPPLSRKLTADSEEGSSFKYQLAKALPLVDPMANNMILINSFNEWHEDTQLEPAVGITASLPVHLTGGLQYAGYGDLYLNILREYTETTEANVFKSSGDGF
jgi:glycoprotein endo-alpha-1,2-mannosidase